jgi:hypothetical protein
MPKSKKKICRCKPTWGKRLAKSTRCKHYRRTEASGQLPSESESTKDLSESRSFTPDDTIAHPDPLLLDDSMDIDYSHDPAMQQESPEPDDTMDLDSSASTSSNSESAPPNSDLSDASDDSLVDWIEFDADLNKDTLKRLDEMERELDEMLFPENERELWEIHMLSLTL